MLHHPAFDFNDAVLSTGAAYWATLVEQQLPFSSVGLSLPGERCYF
jgi:hippurate hydrolase